ncbi:MAG: GNAT family N-acetyltransferase [Gammaproteobacteria bacterium]|nr:GNAT family N-acetyltransferase [Gammaproteobacteria bacterium]
MDINIVEINKGDPYMDQIERLFSDLYQYMSGTGLQMQIVEDGASIWRSSIEKLTGGRYGMLYAAISDEKVIGFAHGSIRYSAEFMGGLKVGHITHLFVLPDYRKTGIGNDLISYLEKWFLSKDVHSYELQVLCDNTLGINFWERNGYKKELLQMRKII